MKSTCLDSIFMKFIKKTNAAARNQDSGDPLWSRRDGNNSTAEERLTHSITTH